MTSRIGIGVVGTGMAALPHARALRDLEDRIEVRGVFSRDPERRSAFSRKWSFPAVDSLDRLVSDPKVDAILLITPPNARMDLVEKFAKAGKHILMEKPVERTTTAAERIVGICADAGVTLGIVFQHRFRMASQKLAGLAADGSMGALRIVQAHVPWWREQAYYDEPGRGTHARDGGGVLISQAIHTLDLMLSLTGPVTQVQALAVTTPFHSMETEDFVAGGLRFANGAVGSIVASTAMYPGQAESLTFNFARASAHLQSGTLTVDWHDGRRDRFGEPATTGGGADPMAFPHEWHRDLIGNFANAITEGREPRIPGSEALHVHRLIDALVQSSQEGAIVTVADGG
ncbi:MAG: Gfo/Idh/MocA family oxidoreductase [Geminicoccaceae bacterium]